jgi:hypothetical protein
MQSYASKPTLKPAKLAYVPLGLSGSRYIVISSGYNCKGRCEMSGKGFDKWWMREQDKRERKKKARFGRGLFLAKLKGQKVRFVTLSHFKKLGKGVWSNFVTDVRRLMPDFEYSKVIHRKGKKEHIHFVYRGLWLDVYELSRLWKKWSGHQVVWIKQVDLAHQHGLYDYMNDSMENDQVRWSSSMYWSPPEEQEFLAEFCISSVGKYVDGNS